MVNVNELKKRDFLSTDDYISYSIFYGDLHELIKKFKEQGECTRLLPWIDRAVIYAFAKGIGAKTSLGYSRFLIVTYKLIR